MRSVTLSESDLTRVRLALLRALDFWGERTGQGAELLVADYWRIYDLLCEPEACMEVCDVGCTYEADDPRHV